ncbi:MAG TPA: acetoacetate decarboxylase family protein, partial [Acidimicrobiales bacterium]|nr:acetoacetate decarboxylase family protein [Acidimicrobiales bacterium]
MVTSPHAPWRLQGEIMLGWVRAPAALRSLLPEGVRFLPGPAALVAAHYTDSPVGPYLELSLAVPARLGLRPGLSVVLQLLSSTEARTGYRHNWGLPATVGQLSWLVDGEARVLRCRRPDLEVRGIPGRPPIPAVVPIRSLQRRADGPVVLPRRLVALVRPARMEVTVDQVGGDGSDVDLGFLAGSHPGLMMATARISAHPARHPIGLLSSLRAPLRAIEP